MHAIGTKVIGVWYGTPFAGVVESTRGHTENFNLWQYTVSLAQPIDMADSKVGRGRYARGECVRTEITFMTALNGADTGCSVRAV
jgi:hypothetical protein